MRKTKTPSKDFLKFLKDTSKADSTGIIKEIFDEIKGNDDFKDATIVFEIYESYLLIQSDKDKLDAMLLCVVFYNRFYGEYYPNMEHKKAFTRERYIYNLNKKAVSKDKTSKDKTSKGKKS